MHILMVGTGYVGLVTASCLAEMGHCVICLDIDADKIDQLQQGIIPFFEPGLKELVERNTRGNRLSFTTDYATAISQSSLCFIAVPTPSQPDGSCDLSFVFTAARQIAAHMDGYRLIVNKSTVPVGTADAVSQIISESLKERGESFPFDVVSNPEFLKEGSAVQDCMKPDRIILGAETEKALATMRELYSPFTLNHDRILAMDPRSAELTKYAANAMLATRISFMNELATLCEQVNANIHHVRIGIGSDKRIGREFLYAGIGYGGSCFPKDIKALQAMGRLVEIDMPILQAVEEINQRQRHLFTKKIIDYFSEQGGLKNKTIALWGLSFKPDTDDIREAPSLYIIKTLLAQGAQLKLYDPVAIPLMMRLHPPSENVIYTTNEYAAAQGADAIVLITEWRQFRFVDFDLLSAGVRQKVFFDGRNQYKPKEMDAKGFYYECIGLAANAPEPLFASSVMATER